MIKRVIKDIFLLTFSFSVCFIISNNKNVSASDTKIDVVEIENLFVTDVLNTSVPHGSNIHINYCIKENDIFNISYSATEVKTEVANNKKFRDTYSYIFYVEELGEKIIEINAKSSSYSGKTEIYVFATEELDYVSTISMSSAKRIYFEDLYEKKLVTEEYYNAVVYGEDCETERIISYQPFSTNYIYIRGTVSFRDNNDTPHGAQNLRIEIYDNESIGKVLLKTIYTNSNGYYSTSILNDTSWLENGYDLIVKIVFSNGDFHVEDFWSLYTHQFEKYQDSPNGLILTQNITFNKDSERNKALHIHQAGNLGFKYLRWLDPSGSFPYLRYIFPTFMGSTYYTPIIHNIDIQSSSGGNWDTALHEFGHYVADIYNLTDFWPAVHSFDQNQTVEHGKSIGPMLAWSEGWATYFAISCQIQMRSSLPNISNLKDDLYRNRSIETDSNYLYGEANEWVIARLLYDLADAGTNEIHDTVSWGFNELFNRLVSAAPWYIPIQSLSEFVYSLNITASDESFGKLFTYYQIASKPTHPLNGALSTFEPPTLSWDAQGGLTHQHVQNNRFVVYLKTSNGTTLFTINAGSNTSVKLTEAQWDTILAHPTPYIKWNVSAEQTSTPVTGPYFSETITIYKPTPITITTSVPTTRTLVNEGDYYWFKFTSPGTGEYSFYTSGTTDTFGEFFHIPVSGRSVTGIIDHDDDGAGYPNFRWSTHLQVGQTIYIRVRGYNWSRIGQFTIKVDSLSPHIHNYNFYQYSQAKHMKVCSCGDVIYENHYMIPLGIGLGSVCRDCGHYSDIGIAIAPFLIDSYDSNDIEMKHYHNLMEFFKFDDLEYIILDKRH